MTEITPAAAPGPPGARPPGTGSASPAQVASARETWISAGLDASKFDLTLNSPSTDPNADDLGSAASYPRARAQYRPGAPEMSHARALEMADALLKAGVPAEAVESALKADGIEQPAPPAPRMPEELQLEAAFGAPDPSEIKVSYVGRVADMDTAALVELNTEATTWASEVGLPAPIAAGVIERALDVGRAWKSWTPAEQSRWKAEQRAVFERIAGGPEKAAEKMALAAKALARGGEAFRERLYSTGALHDAGVVLHLANQGARQR